MRFAQTEQEIGACEPVLRQLRPHLEGNAFVPAIRRLQALGSHCVWVDGDNGHPGAVAVFRIAENTAWGRHMYIDDLVCDERQRSTGLGGRLLEDLVQYARECGCGQVHLDSGVQRFGAHRFYLAHRFDITSHHFALKL